MSFKLSKTLMVLLCCLTFVGQAVASTVMSYHMISMKGMSMSEMSEPAQSHNMLKMNNSNHAMASDANLNTSKNSSKNCCNNQCDCFTGGCSNTAAIIKVVSSNLIINDFSPKILSISNLALSQQLTSLYKPPILG